MERPDLESDPALLLDLCHTNYVILSVCLGAFRARGVEEVCLLHILSIRPDALIEFLAPVRNLSAPRSPLSYSSSRL